MRGGTWEKGILCKLLALSQFRFLRSDGGVSGKGKKEETFSILPHPQGGRLPYLPQCKFGHVKVKHDRYYSGFSHFGIRFMVLQTVYRSEGERVRELGKGEWD